MMTTSQVSEQPRRYLYLLIVAFCGFVTSFAAHVVNTNLAAYGTTMGVGAFIIGLIIAAYGFAELLTKPLAGFIADRAGMKRVLQIGIVGFIFASFLFFFINPTYLILIRFLQGLGASAFSTLSVALVAKYFIKGRGIAYGIYNTIKGIGYAIAPLSGGVLVVNWGFSSLFLVTSFIASLAFLMSCFLPSDREMDGRDGVVAKSTFQQFLEPFEERRLLPVYGAIVINTFLVGALFGFLPIYLYSRGYTPVESGIVISFVTISYVSIQPIAGYLADRIDIRLTIIIGLFLAGLGISIATFTSGTALVFCVVFAACGAGIVWTNCDTLVSLLVKDEKLGAGMGAAQFFKEFGDMGGPLFIGGMSQLFGIQIGFVMCGVLALLSLIIVVHAKTFKQAFDKII
ncbi:MAG: MFS transporter [Alphaproteobacteria bacterium]|nr:MFS transporter [Alphaproteobacteria bacterium]